MTNPGPLIHVNVVCTDKSHEGRRVKVEIFQRSAYGWTMFPAYQPGDEWDHSRPAMRGTTWLHDDKPLDDPLDDVPKRPRYDLECRLCGQSRVVARSMPQFSPAA